MSYPFQVGTPGGAPGYTVPPPFGAAPPILDPGTSMASRENVFYQHLMPGMQQQPPQMALEEEEGVDPLEQPSGPPPFSLAEPGDDQGRRRRRSRSRSRNRSSRRRSRSASPPARSNRRRRSRSRSAQGRGNGRNRFRRSRTRSPVRDRRRRSRTRSPARRRSPPRRSPPQPHQRRRHSRTRSPLPPRRRTRTRSPSQHRIEPFLPQFQQQQQFSQPPPGMQLNPYSQMPPLMGQAPPLMGQAPPAMAPTVTPGSELNAVLREMINIHSGVLEFASGKSWDYKETAFFHESAVFVGDPNGNPYGPAMPLAQLKLPLASFSQAGSEWKVYSVSVPSGRNLCFNKIVLAMWPKTTESPQQLPDSARLMQEFETFQKNLDYSALVHSSIHGLDYVSVGRKETAVATVAEIRDDKYGLLEVKYSGVFAARFKVLFHREDVFLKDGKRAVEHKFFKDKPLDKIAAIGSPVTFSARSITMAKGYDIKPVKMELQAICVSLNAESLPTTCFGPTSCDIGRGLYGKCKRRTPIYFQESLMVRLNKKLAGFLFSNPGTVFPMIDQTLMADITVETVPVKRAGNHRMDQYNPSLPTVSLGKDPQLHQKLSNAYAVVKELLTDHSGIIENMSKTWMCYFTSSHTLLPPGCSLNYAMKPGTRVQLNANLIDSKQQMQYLATLVWNKKDFPEQARVPSNNVIDNTMLQKYYDTNEIFAIEGGGPATTAAMPMPIASRFEDTILQEYEDIFEAQHGIVYKLLDENFGLLRISNCLVLFDTCDFWTQPHVTAQSEGKRLQDVVQVDTKVRFHATLLDCTAKIQYLATSIWLATDRRFDDQTAVPKPIEKELIHKDKVNIYRTVVQSVGPALPVLRAVAVPRQPPAPKPVPASDPDLLMSQRGLVKVTFLEGDKVTGGVVEFGERQLCYFHTNMCNMGPERVQGIRQDCVVNVNVKGVRGLPWNRAIQHIALSLYDQDAVVAENPLQVQEKYLQGVASFEEVLKNTGLKFFNQMSPPKLSSLQMGTYRMERVSGEARFVTFITTESGVLEDVAVKGRFIYFERSDLNFGQPVQKLTELVSLFATKGVSVKYTATPMSGCSISLAALTMGIQVEGQLPVSLLYAVPRFDVEPYERVATSLNKARFQRFSDASLLFNEGQMLSLDKIKVMERGALMPIVKTQGIVKIILNENFALVHGPSPYTNSSYCLFDTFDLMVANGVSAADQSKNISDVVSVGDFVLYNACVIEEEHVVPYLATSVWTAGRVSDVAPLTRSEIQEQKVQIYRQVINSCGGVVMKKAQEEEQSVRTMDAVLMSRQAALQQVVAEKNQQMREQARVNKQYNSIVGMKAKPVADIAATLATAPLLINKINMDVNDAFTSGKLVEEKSDQFAILEMNNGEKCLVTSERVWINDKPKFGAWRALHLSYFKQVNISARKVSGFASFSYQAVFAHAGMHKRDFHSKEFQYPLNMQKWISTLHNENALDTELTKYRQEHESINL